MKYVRSCDANAFTCDCSMFEYCSTPTIKLLTAYEVYDAEILRCSLIRISDSAVTELSGDV